VRMDRGHGLGPQGVGGGGDNRGSETSLEDGPAGALTGNHVVLSVFVFHLDIVCVCVCLCVCVF